MEQWKNNIIEHFHIYFTYIWYFTRDTSYLYRLKAVAQTARAVALVPPIF